MVGSGEAGSKAYGRASTLAQPLLSLSQCGAQSLTFIPLHKQKMGQEEPGLLLAWQPPSDLSLYELLSLSALHVLSSRINATF